MRKTILLVAALFLLAVTFFISCTNANASQEKDPMPTVMTSEQLVSRGEYLVNSIGCDDCHSPKRMGAHGPEIIPELRLSGFSNKTPLPSVNVNEVKKGWAMFAPDLTSAVGPWGQSYAANITSDETGIGLWTEANFFNAIRHGKSKGIETNRPLLPPMPWFVYRNMTDDDLKSIFAYLKSTKPVKNIVPSPKSLDEIK